MHRAAFTWQPASTSTRTRVMRALLTCPHGVSSLLSHDFPRAEARHAGLAIRTHCQTWGCACSLPLLATPLRRPFRPHAVRASAIPAVSS
jgi:hypothetical protein